MVMEPGGNMIDAAAVKAALAGTSLGGHVLHLAEVASTNDLAIEAAVRGARHGVWVADAQTAGRGRGGHTWHSEPGDGLYVSALFSPQLPAEALQLSLAAGLAAWEAIGAVAGVRADIRWPNDLVTLPDGAGRSRKLGGVLVETAIAAAERDGGPGTLRYAVIGVGINVAHGSFPPELAGAATSLRLEGWQQPDRQPLLIDLLQRLSGFVARMERSHAGGEASALPAQLEAASTWVRGKRVQVAEDGGYTGVTAGLDRSGFLLVDADDRSRRTVRSGGVREL